MLQRAERADRMVRLANAAEIEFARSGVASASIDSIARRARVSRQFVYTHFGGKEQLYQFVRRRAEKLLFETVGGIGQQSGPALESIRSFIDAMFDAYINAPVLGTMLADQAMHGTRVIRPDSERQTRIEMVRASLDAILERGRREGTIRRDWDGTSFYFIAAALIIGVLATGSNAAIDRDWATGFLMRALSTPACAVRHDLYGLPAPESVDDRDAIGRILSAAEVSFTTIGLEAASIRAIARDARVSEQLVYHYFESKPLLYQAVQTRLVERCMPYFEVIDFDAVTPVDAVGLYVATYARVLALHPTSMLLDMDNRLQRRGDDVGDAAIRSRRERLLKRFGAALARGKADGSLHADINARRLYIVSAVVFCSAGAMAGPELRGEAGKTLAPLSLKPEHLREFVIQGAVA